MNASDVLVENLIDWGVDTDFGIPGDGINGTMKSRSWKNEFLAGVDAKNPPEPDFSSARN